MKTLLAVMVLVAGFTAHAEEESTTKAKKEEIMKEQAEKARDREYWAPLKREIEQLRREARTS